MDKFLFFAFILLVLLAPLPFGGNIPVAWTANAFVAGLLVVLISVRNLALRRSPDVPLGWIAGSATLFTLVCIWAIVQSFYLTPEALHNQIWSAASEAFGRQLDGAISVNPFETRVSLMRIVTYGAVFWMALQFARERSRAIFLLHALAVGIALYALYGVVLWSVGSELIPWYEHGAGRGAVSSTFINRNNFATFTGMGSVLFLGLLLHQLQKLLRAARGERFKYRLERFLAALAGRFGFYLIGLLLTLGTLFLTQSRAGFLSTLLALGVLVGLNLLAGWLKHSKAGQRGRKGGRAGMAGLLMALIMAVGAITVTFGMSGDQITTRLVRSDLTSEGRRAVYPRLIEAIRDSPLLGTGYGSFPDVFPLYRDETISAFGRWDKAHNTYLEVMMELGLPAALMLFLATGFLVAICLRGALTRYRNAHIPLIGFACSVLVGVHSMADFSLQIPGLAVTYAAVLGLGVAQSWSSQRR